MRKGLYLFLSIILICGIVLFVFLSRKKGEITVETPSQIESRAEESTAESSRSSQYPDNAAHSRKSIEEIEAMFKKAATQKQHSPNGGGSVSVEKKDEHDKSTKVGADATSKDELSKAAAALLNDPEVKIAVQARQKACEEATSRIKECSGSRPIHRQCSFGEQLDDADIDSKNLTACLEADAALYQCGTMLPCWESIQWWNHDSKTLCRREQEKRDAACGSKAVTPLN